MVNSRLTISVYFFVLLFEHIQRISLSGHFLCVNLITEWSSSDFGYTYVSKVHSSIPSTCIFREKDGFVLFRWTPSYFLFIWSEFLYSNMSFVKIICTQCNIPHLKFEAHRFILDSINGVGHRVEFSYFTNEGLSSRGPIQTALGAPAKL